jgi:hypothetical protein
MVDLALSGSYVLRHAVAALTSIYLIFLSVL